MLAEIYNKISQTGSNLSDRLEDKLTADFFGTVRYLPFEHGLKHVFTRVEFFKEYIKAHWIDFIEHQKGYTTEMEFWHRTDEGEIDLIITHEEALIGIEIKYLSGLSSEDQDSEYPIDYTESVNQLARYSLMLEKISNGRNAYLLFLAPYEMMNRVMKSMKERAITSPSVQLGFLCWEDILESFNDLNLENVEKGQQLIVNDLQALLMKKGLVRFHGFNNKVLNQPIETVAYSFGFFDSNAEENSFGWPKRKIRKDEFYVYNNY